LPGSTEGCRQLRGELLFIPSHLQIEGAEMKSTVTLMVCVRCAMLGLFAFFLAGCSASETVSGAVYSERPVPLGKSLIYVYREGEFAGGKTDFRLFSNGQEIARVGHKGYFDLVADPGQIKFSELEVVELMGIIPKLIDNSGGPRQLCTLQAEPDHEYYLRLNIWTVGLDEVSKSDAVKALTGMHRFEEVKPASQ
jgi:hypothetical protein